jgi:hypothetical protein
MLALAEWAARVAMRAAGLTRALSYVCNYVVV